MRIYAAAAAAIGWFALALQLYLLLRVNAQAAIWIPETLVRYLSYFTILSNLLAASVLTSAALAQRDTFLSRHSVRTAVAVYITMVAIVYVTLLRQLWQPQGAQWLADVLLHYAMPAIYLLFWFAFQKKGGLEWPDAVAWLGFPILFAIFALIRGSLSGFYPYPFLDLSKLSAERVALNSFGMFVCFLVVGMIYVLIDYAIGKRSVPAT
jgi:hypothetical protein